MLNRLQEGAAWVLPSLALGLYCGRVVSEIWATGSAATSWPLAVLFTASCCVPAFFITHPHHLKETWPLLILYAYVLSPNPDMTYWLLVGLTTAVTFFLSLQSNGSLPSLPGNGRRTLLVAAVVVVVVAAGLIYVLTLAPGLLPADSGEFQLVARELGVAHPPGFPLYTMLAHLMTRLPIGASPAWRVNLLSALTSAATLGFIYLATFALTKRHLAALTAVLALGSATTFWAQATTANIRSLTALFAAIAFWAAIRLYLAQRQGEATGNRDRWLIILAFSLSLGFTHHLSLAFVGLVLVLFVVVVDPGILKTPRRWLGPLLATLLGLVPLLYLPLRADDAIRGSNDALATAGGFLRHFLGLGFQGDFFYFSAPSLLGERLLVMGNVLTFQFSSWLLLGMLVGLILLWWREWQVALLLTIAFALHTLITAMYRAPQTVEYMMPAYVPAVLCLGYAVGYLEIAADRGGRLRLVLQPLSQLFVSTLFVVALFQGWPNWSSYRELKLVEDSRDYAQSLLAAAPDDSAILANWHWVTPLWYLQSVEGQRPDVTIRYVAPSTVSYGASWAAAIEAELADGRDVLATWNDEAAYGTLPRPEPVGEALWFRQLPRSQLPASFTELTGSPSPGFALRGYQVAHSHVEIWQTFLTTVAWEHTADLSDPLSLSVHLIGPDGRSVGQADHVVIASVPGIQLTQFRLTPGPSAQPGTYTVTLFAGDETIPLTTVALLPMQQAPFTQQPVNMPEVLPVGGTRTLIGLDRDSSLPEQDRLYFHWSTPDGFVTDFADGPAGFAGPELLAQGPWGLPRLTRPGTVTAAGQHYVPLGAGLVWTGNVLDPDQTISPSAALRLDQKLASSRPLVRDYVTSVRLIGYEDDGYLWAWCDLVDYVPALGAIPTLKWIAGSQVTSPHHVVYTNEPLTNSAYCQSVKPVPGAPLLAVANEAQSGQAVGGTLVVYDAFTKRPLPILDQRIRDQFPWIPLGQTRID